MGLKQCHNRGQLILAVANTQVGGTRLDDGYATHHRPLKTQASKTRQQLVIWVGCSSFGNSSQGYQNVPTRAFRALILFSYLAHSPKDLAPGLAYVDACNLHTMTEMCGILI